MTDLPPQPCTSAVSLSHTKGPVFYYLGFSPFTYHPGLNRVSDELVRRSSQRTHCCHLPNPGKLSCYNSYFLVKALALFDSCTFFTVRQHHPLKITQEHEPGVRRRRNSFHHLPASDSCGGLPLTPVPEADCPRMSGVECNCAKASLYRARWNVTGGDVCSLIMLFIPDSRSQWPLARRGLRFSRSPRYNFSEVPPFRPRHQRRIGSRSLIRVYHFEDSINVIVVNGGLNRRLVLLCV